MSPVSLLPIVVIFCVALGTIYVLLRSTGVNVTKDRFASIDGLRGILAFSVFLHHSVIWYFYLRTNEWGAPPSRVYSQFGPGGVAMFFMITAFLFYSKLLNARGKGIDWVKLYVSRLYRIMPLYLFAVVIVFAIVGVLSHFTLYSDIFHLFAQFIKWVFAIEVDVNGVAGTKRIVAGVVWTLAFEWMFYWSLALVGRTIYRIPAPVYILIITGILFFCFLGIIVRFYPDEVVRKVCPFAGGIAAAYLVRNARVRKFSASKAASLLIILLAIVTFLYNDLAHPVSFVSLCLVFIMIACGNELFGLLTHRLTRYLGMVSYSLYLLHGPVLFVAFRFVIGLDKAKNLSPEGHWLVVGSCAVLLMGLCSLTYFYIEKAAQRKKAGAVKEIGKAMG
jgi:peptidoglycan/LPS O-acetylase OafA/YrhL